MEDLTIIPNIGPTLADKLNRIGVTTFDELVEMGSVKAVMRIEPIDKSACYNMLYALEGAIRGLRWHAIPKDERAQLKMEFDHRITTPNLPV